MIDEVRISRLKLKDWERYSCKDAIDKQVREVKNSIKTVQNEIKQNTQTWQKQAGENLNKELKKVELVNKENFELLSNGVNALKNKILNCTAVESSATSLPPTDNSPYNLNSCLPPTELSLPYFEDITKINAFFSFETT
jgi:hypothetical protein